MPSVVRLARLITAITLLLELSAFGQPDAAHLAQVDVLQNTLAAVAEQVRPSVVAIRADRRVDTAETGDDNTTLPEDAIHRRLRQRLMPAVGSGVIIRPDGLVLTNEHVVRDAEPEAIECVLATGERYTVQGITTDPRSDLAVLRIDAQGLTPARLGDADTARQGHFAIVMGNPFGSAIEAAGKPAMAFGIISALGQDLTQRLDPQRTRYYGNLLQTDARINPGNSGGPLLNIKGEVIGLITAISSRSGGSEGVGYAIAVDERIKKTIARLARGEEVEYGYLGVVLKEPTPADRARAGAPEQGGALVDEVQPGTPATSRLQPGDIIVALDGKPLGDVDTLIRLVGAAPVGIPVNVVICRGGQRMTVPVALTRRPDADRGVNFEVPLAWRGMKLENATAQVRDRFGLPEHAAGVVITYVEPRGLAEIAGLKAGQVLRRVNDEPVKGVRRLHDIAPGWKDAVKIVIDADPPVEITLPASAN